MKLTAETYARRFQATCAALKSDIADRELAAMKSRQERRRDERALAPK